MEGMITFGLRLPPQAVEEIKELAATHYVHPRTLVRSWIMQRFNAIKNDEMPVLGGDLPAWMMKHGTKVLPGEECYER